MGLGPLSVLGHMRIAKAKVEPCICAHVHSVRLSSLQMRSLIWAFVARMRHEGHFRVLCNIHVIDGDIFEPQREAMYLLTCAPSEESNQLAYTYSLITVYVVLRKKLCYSKCAQLRFWSDCTRWSESSLVAHIRITFSDVETHFVRGQTENRIYCIIGAKSSTSSK